MECNVNRQVVEEREQCELVNHAATTQPPRSHHADTQTRRHADTQTPHTEREITDHSRSMVCWTAHCMLDSTFSVVHAGNVRRC